MAAPTIEIYLGMYISNVNANDVIYCLCKSKNVLAYLYNTTEIAVARSDVHTITYNAVTYKRKVVGEYSAVVTEFTSGASPANPGTTGRIIRVSSNYVFKSCPGNNTSLDAVSQEVSRNLYALAHGLPHAYCYGIYQNGSQYFIIEEKLDVERFERHICKFKPLSITSYPGGDDPISQYNRHIYEMFINYICQFQKIVELLKANNMGGDFKLDNMGYRNGTDVICLTDVFHPKVSNPYQPISWNEWEPIAVAEGKYLSIYTNPMSRLAYKLSNTNCTAGGKQRKTRRKTNRKASRRKIRR